MKSAIPSLVTAIAITTGCGGNASHSNKGVAGGGGNEAIGGASGGKSSSVAKGGRTGRGGANQGGKSASTGGKSNTASGTTETGGNTSAGGSTEMGGTSSAQGGLDQGGGSSTAGGSALGGAKGQGGSSEAGGVTGIGGASTGGTVASSTPPKPPPCGSLRESVRGYWSLDETLTSRRNGGNPLVAVPSAATPTYVPGLALGHAMDVSSGVFAELTDSAFNVTDALTLSAFVKASSPEGRIIDRITAGLADGYLLDVYQGKLRMIAGSRLLTSATDLSASSEFRHVAGVFTGGSAPLLRLYVDGELTGEAAVPAGETPTNSLALRVGADSDGNNRFEGSIDEPMVFSRALSADELKLLGSALRAGECPTPVANASGLGLLLTHDATGTVSAGDMDLLRSSIRSASDLQVLTSNARFDCDWNGIVNESLVGCQARSPFLVTLKTGGTYAPAEPVAWQLFKFNTSGVTDELRVRLESAEVTLHEQANLPLTWLGRDWRKLIYRTDAAPTDTLGTTQALLSAVQAGAGMGLFLPTWGYSLPHLTQLLPQAGNGLAALDPWHISTASSSNGELLFQSSPYHYAVWFDTTGYAYASRWYLGSASSISDSPETLPLDFYTEPGYVEVLATDGTGAVLQGSVSSLKNAIEAGSAVRIHTNEGYYDCSRLLVDAGVSCLLNDAYAPADLGNGHTGFAGGHQRALRLFTTEGRNATENWADHTDSLASSSDSTLPLRWFVQSSDWNRALSTDATGSVLSGSVAALVSAIRQGAAVTVASTTGATTEYQRCESLRFSEGPAHVACLALPEVQKRLAGSTAVKGHYEPRVYNSNGVVASARVAFGSTTIEGANEAARALSWYVRNE